uniref:Protein COFACTOR ASSEMBLY OF COMPLEX C SUBUNIT B CCB2, chloroplastic n=1 Tax=Aegilops tauschii subsp. strangulata TaxID=200361 RepID=A0A452YNR7_AEGTS
CIAQPLRPATTHPPWLSSSVHHRFSTYSLPPPPRKLSSSGNSHPHPAAAPSPPASACAPPTPTLRSRSTSPSSASPSVPSSPATRPLSAAELVALNHSYTPRGTIAGIPGLDESYLPRWIGLGFGALVLLNHLLSPSPTPAQLRSEALGLCLAAFSAALPYLGRFLEGAGASSRVPLPEGSRQVFVIPDDLSTAQKEDMAWATYVLLQNTNTTSVV